MNDHPMQASALSRHIVLTGFMGSGKSTLARMLAGRLGTAYHDLDEVIEHRQGMRVRTIFETMGEAQFRRLERDELAGLLRLAPHVLALGGGALATPQNRSRIGSRGLLLYVKVDPAVLAKRLQDVDDRPLLLDKQGQVMSQDRLAGRIEALLGEREHLYMKADVVFEVASSWNPEQTFEHLLRILPASVFTAVTKAGVNEPGTSTTDHPQANAAPPARTETGGLF